jgi:hypothetical protein
MSAIDTYEQPRELVEFIKSARTLPSEALTACTGQTMHHVVAHMVGSYDEATRHTVAYHKGEPLFRTRTFDEREPQFRSMPTRQLLTLLEERESEMREAVLQVIGADPDATLLWVNRQVKVAGFLTHLRMECALHRWDLVGDDDISTELLSEEWITRHTIDFVGPAPLMSRGQAACNGTGRPLRARLRAPGQLDVVITVNQADASIAMEPEGGRAVITGDAAARLLLLWGRKAIPPARLTLTSDSESLERVQLMFCGY